MFYFKTIATAAANRGSGMLGRGLCLNIKWCALCLASWPVYCPLDPHYLRHTFDLLQYQRTASQLVMLLSCVWMHPCNEVKEKRNVPLGALVTAVTAKAYWGCQPLPGVTLPTFFQYLRVHWEYSSSRAFKPMWGVIYIICSLSWPYRVLIRKNVLCWFEVFECCVL